MKEILVQIRKEARQLASRPSIKDRETRRELISEALLRLAPEAGHLIYMDRADFVLVQPSEPNLYRLLPSAPDRT